MSGYKRYDRDKTDFDKVHWVNGSAMAVGGAPVAMGDIVLMPTGERNYGLACAALAAVVVLGLVVYGKTGDRYGR